MGERINWMVNERENNRSATIRVQIYRSFLWDDSRARETIELGRVSVVVDTQDGENGDGW